MHCRSVGLCIRRVTHDSIRLHPLQDYHVANLVQASADLALVATVTMPSASRSKKLRCLNERRRKQRHATASALAVIWEDCAEHGIPDARSRTDIAGATDEALNTETPHGIVITSITCKAAKEGADDVILPAVNPLAFIWVAFQNGGGFAALMEETIVAFRIGVAKPLELIVYADEVTPG